MRGMAAMFRSEFNSLREKGLIVSHPDAEMHVCHIPSSREGFDHVRIWYGNRSKPGYNYLIPASKAAAYVAEKLESGRRSVAAKARMKADAKAAADENAGKYTVGTILHGSWGYDQTNCEFYEVVGRPSRHYAEIRPIAGEMTRATGPMACMMKPVPGNYTGKPIRKKIGPHGIKAHAHCWLSPTDPETEHYDSWYA